MKGVHRSQTFREHFWERRLEVHDGIECVVRSCRYCGCRELCWSRRPIPAEALDDVTHGKDRRERREIPDKEWCSVSTLT
jgi:hypothetical protein